MVNYSTCWDVWRKSLCLIVLIGGLSAPVFACSVDDPNYQAFTYESYVRLEIGFDDGMLYHGHKKYGRLCGLSKRFGSDVTMTQLASHDKFCDVVKILNLKYVNGYDPLGENRPNKKPRRGESNP